MHNVLGRPETGTLRGLASWTPVPAGRLEAPSSRPPTGPTAWLVRSRGGVHRLLEAASPDDGASQLVDRTIIALIALSVVTGVLETVESIRASHGAILEAVEFALTFLFSIEYLLRVWSSAEIPRFGPGWPGRLRYVLSPLALIDLLAILPNLLAVGSGACPQVLRLVRLCRLLRVFKLGRYSQALQLVGKVLSARRAELGVILWLDGLLILVAATLLYVVENGHQPQIFSSIPAAMWWAVITLTTIGYGDAYPVTVIGKALTGTLALLAVGMIALPTGLLSSSFMEEMQRSPSREGCCPACGRSRAGAEP